MVNSDIERFNEYANINYEALFARGDRCNDMMSNLFKGYLAAGEKEFVRYIQNQKDSYNNG